MNEHQVKRIAAVDMGSNTTRFMVADVTRSGDEYHHQPIVQRSVITRLAEGVAERGILLPEPITRVRNALIDFRLEAKDLGAVFVLATATSAVRDADNGEAFLGEVEHGFAFRAELLSGTQEAKTTWRGVTSDPEFAQAAKHGTGFLIDIGGGSTEITLTSDGEVIDHHSFQLGSVRLFERFLKDSTDPPQSLDLDAARAYAAAEISQRFSASEKKPQIAIAVAGTATTVASILIGSDEYQPEKVHGYSITRTELDGVVAKLAALPLKERELVAGLEPKRAEVILGGLVILQAALAHFNLDAFRISDRDILDGIALLAGEIAHSEDIEEMQFPFGNTCC